MLTRVNVRDIIFLRDRLGVVRRLTSAALLCGIALSMNLWFPISRSLPRAPLLIALPLKVIAPVEYFLSTLLSAALVALVFAKRPMKYLIVVIVALTLLCLLDQTRLQPWVYQYLVVFVVLALGHRQSRGESPTVLTALQLIVASLYFWGGLQKLNYSFSHEVLPQLLNILALSPRQLLVLGIVIAVIETLTGFGLLLKQTRKICICLALAMHALILGLLIAQNQNSVVWVWNVALALMVVVLFWRSDNSIAQAFRSSRTEDTRSRASVRASIIVTALYVVLPVLSFWGWWDLYLSGALYSGNTPVAVVRVDGEVYDRLSPTPKRQVFVTGSGERMLPLHEWSMADLNVPPYPELRVYRQLTREICRSANDNSHAELIVKTRPALMDGRYKVVRMDCSNLDD